MKPILAEDDTKVTRLEPLPATMLRAMRPHQWLKNLLILLPLIASHSFFVASITQCALAFLAFSLVASSVYVTNDILDIEVDRLHPRKRFRPFASGALSITQGRVMTLVLILAGASVAAFVGKMFVLIWVIYLITTLAYSIFLKRVAILDILVLSILYCVRIAAGGAALGIEISYWLLTFSIFFFFFLAGIKRLAEILDHTERGQTAIPGRGYRTDDLRSVSMISVSAGFVSVVVLALYVSSPDVVGLYAAPEFLWGTCVTLIYWVSYVILVTNRGEMHDDPIVFALTDKTSLICLAVVICFALAALGVPGWIGYAGIGYE